jgi:hypothetical protein
VVLSAIWNYTRHAEPVDRRPPLHVYLDTQQTGLLWHEASRPGTRGAPTWSHGVALVLGRLVGMGTVSKCQDMVSAELSSRERPKGLCSVIF